MEKIKSELPSITESEFKKYLPMLLSNEPDADRRPWLDICIDPRLRVNIVDDKTGELLHQVPPLHYTSNSLVGNNVAGKIKEWLMLNEVSALHGKAFARKHITSDLITSEPPEEDVELWKMIIKRYGYASKQDQSADNVNTNVLQDNPEDW